MSSHRGVCRACKAPMLWATMPSGRQNPLNATEVEPEVGKGVAAFNPKTGKGMPVTIANIEQCSVWAERGVTFHLSHFATCPERGRFRKESESVAAASPDD